MSSCYCHAWASDVEVRFACEGRDDAAVAVRLLRHVGLEPSSRSPGSLGGKSKLDPKLPAYLRAAAHESWFALRDLDHDYPCAPAMLDGLAPDRPARMLLRVVVRAVESWLLADRKGIASFLGVPATKVPRGPDALARPKLEMVNLARRSTRRPVVHDMVPREGAGNLVGPAYTDRLIEFIQETWDPDRARSASPSLDRCLMALVRLRQLGPAG